MSWDLIEKSGRPTDGGYELNENNMTLNQVTDLDTDLSVTLNGLGVAQGTWSYINKN